MPRLADDIEQADNTLDELLRFIAGLRVQRAVKKQEADALEELLFNNSSLIFAAYSVAKSAGDIEYLTEVCKDIAQSMMSAAGQSACAAQEDVLQCCDRLYIDNKITDNQLLYLRHLVLIRDEDVAQMYDEFQENFDLTRLMVGLLRLANLQQKVTDEVPVNETIQTQNAQQQTNSEDIQQAIKKQQSEIASHYKQKKTVKQNNQKEEIKSRANKANPYRKKSNESPTATVQTSPTNPTEVPKQASEKEQTIMMNTLNGIIALMIRTGDITPIEAVLLNQMITSHNEFIFAAYEIFQTDGNVVELQDTLARCAKIEVKKRGLEQQKPKKPLPASRGKNNKSATSTKRNQRSQPRPQIVSETEADDEESPSSSDDNSQPRVNTQSDNFTPDEIEAPQSCDSPTQLGRLLSSLNVTNVWQNTVPTKFVYTVFSATQKRLLSIGQCRALCDLFQSQYDLVRAAWEVFNVQDDTFDFIDTLKRIVRDLNFQDDGNVNLSVGYDEAANDDQSDPESEPKTKDIVQVMKSNALAAVAEAKRELLKHSLEIMVKQGLVTTQAASTLFERALKGDPLIDAAIEGYAGDRNIMEFLDTLQILANNTPEDLEKMLLRAAMNSGEDDNEEDQEEDDDEDDQNDESEEDQDQDDEPEEVEDDEEVDGVEEEEDEVSDNQNDSEFDEIQMELKSFAKEMLKRGDFDRDNYNSLLEMIALNDDRVLAAHDVYRSVSKYFSYCPSP
jgi:D-ribose pyranose/furanose isomerase RbsD